MKILAISVWRFDLSDEKTEEKVNNKTGNADLIEIIYDVSSFNYFARKSIREFLKFGSRTLVDKLIHSQTFDSRVVISPDKPDLDFKFNIHCILSSRIKFGVVIVTDGDYPHYAAHQLLVLQLQNTFQLLDTSLSKAEYLKNMNEKFIKYQNPTKVDKIAKIQQELDEVKEIMHKNVEDIIGRGVSIDILMQKSQDLSENSIKLAGKAKDLTRCCKLW